MNWVNQKENSLALYLFSRNQYNIDTIIEGTNSGAVCINETTVNFFHSGMPFGGNGYSGIGKAHGHAGFLEFTNRRGVLRQRVGFTTIKLFYPPFTRFTEKFLAFVMRYLA